MGRLTAGKRLELADCSSLALARKPGAALLAADRHEFDRVAEEVPGAARLVR